MKIFEDVDHMPGLQEPRTQLVLEMMSLLPGYYPNLPEPGQWRNIDVTLAVDGVEVDVRAVLGDMFRRPDASFDLAQAAQIARDIQLALRKFQPGEPKPTTGGEEAASGAEPVGQPERDLWGAAMQTWRELNGLLDPTGTWNWEEMRKCYRRITESFLQIGRVLADPTFSGRRRQDV